MDEKWRAVPDWEGFYEVSNLGKVRSIPHQTARGVRGGKLLAQYIREDGYPEVYLFDKAHKRRRTARVHHLVLEAFVGKCPKGQEARHGPGGKLDAALKNLKWGTRAKNVGPDRVRDHQSNRGEHHGLTHLTWDDVCKIRELLAEHYPQNALADLYHVSKQTITNIKYRRVWAHPPEEW